MRMMHRCAPLTPWLTPLSDVDTDSNLTPQLAPSESVVAAGAFVIDAFSSRVFATCAHVPSDCCGGACICHMVRTD